MPQLPPATPGMPYADIDTPALVLDLDAFERNLKRMADAVAKAGVRLRPHAKTHKSPVIGLKQMALGAVGMCCQKVSEAEAMVLGGVPDVLRFQRGDRHDASSTGWRGWRIKRASWWRPITKWLSRRWPPLQLATASACACWSRSTSAATAAASSPASRRWCWRSASPGRRACSSPVCRPITAAPSTCAPSRSARRPSPMPSRRRGRTVDLLKRAGLACEVVGGAGSGTYEIEAASGVYTELQAGSYVFMDADYARNKNPDGSRYNAFEHSLFVLATVMSTPIPERAVIDAGLKTFSFDQGVPEISGARRRRL